ncbi:MAG: S41 family peptidase [Muribaculaceae bacterium]|nr:S41 family peptidase [Muribaculaceae bacterium]
MSDKKTSGRYLPLIGALILAGGIWLGYCLADGDKATDTQRKLARVFDIIDSEYVDDIDIDSVIENSLPLMLENLDPHSVYISAADRAAANQRLDGSFSGIGIQFQQLNDTVVVVEVIKGGPSERVGLRAGDRIVWANDSTLVGPDISTDDVRSLLRGPRGSVVEVGVVRRDVPDMLKFKIVRNDVPIESIDASYMVADGIGYIKVNTFGRNTYPDFLQDLYALHREGAKSFIIDLRGNTGGFMDPAIMMVNEFLAPRQTIVATRGRNERENSIVVSDGTGNFSDVPMVVLIDEFSASSSEIFSGAIQDNDRGLIVGRRSFGKGLVQRSFELPDSSELRLTVQRYYTPSGRCIQKDFTRGDVESYESEILERYSHGENFSADSARLNTAEVFHTAAGREVYGGGGIMPDVFVPSDTAGVNKFYLELANAGLLNSFAFEYVDLNRADLMTAGNTAELLEKLPSDAVLLSAFAAYAKDKGVRMRYYYLNNSRRLIVRQLKALIARDVLGVQAYYEIDLTDDPAVQEAIRQITSGAAASVSVKD